MGLRMKRMNLSWAIRNALVSAAASTVIIQGVGHAQAIDEEEEDIAEQGLITVTGSRLKRVDFEVPQPVTVITRADMDETGEISVAEVLRRQPFNQFGSRKERSGSNAQSQSTVSLRGLGAQRTLVLLDGRRFAGSGPIGDGSATNLNTIPMAAVADNSGTPVVTAIRDGKAYETEVELGAETGDFVQVLHGLAPGDTVAIAGGYGLPESCPVHIVVDVEATNTDSR